MSERPILIQSGTVVDPATQTDGPADVLIRDGLIEAVDSGIDPPDGTEIIDAKGKIVAPGLIDVHVHLREPGMEEAETVASGARAAAV
ncbi:MAG: amidohydrolase family protein, partial [Gemmatimonadales bacterium]